MSEKRTAAMRLALVGLPGSGKSSAGLVAAALLGLPFVDVDARIEERFGISVADFFRRHGETAFRREESLVLGEVARAGPCLVACGGGSVLDPGNRLLLAREFFTIWLRIEPDRALARVAREPGLRPLFAEGDARELMARLAADRERLYAESSAAWLSADEPDPQALAERIAALASRAASASLVEPGAVAGSLGAFPSKSLAQRALACALLAEGESLIRNTGLCDDTLAALGTARVLGARIREDRIDKAVSPGEDFSALEPCHEPRAKALASLRVRGLGAALLDSRDELNLDCGQSALCMRLFAPIAALRRGPTTLLARGSLRGRSMAMLEPSLRALGALCRSERGLPPLRVRGPLAGGEILVDASQSSQLLSGLLVALPLAPGDSRMELGSLVSSGYVDLTLSVMKAFGVEPRKETKADGRLVFHVQGRRSYRAADYRVEGDWSGSAFFLVAGAIAAAEALLVVHGLCPSSAQPDRAILDALRAAGVPLVLGCDSVAVSRPSRLAAFNFDATDCPDLFPPLAILAAYCDDTSQIKGAQRLRSKESDRAEGLLGLLSAMGIGSRLEGDSLLVEGLGRCGTKPRGALVDARGDHRMAMAAAVAALGASGPVRIVGADSVEKSWPGFFEDMASLRKSQSRRSGS